MKRVVLMIGALFLLAAAPQNDARDLFFRANALYEKGDYQAAAELYAKIIDSGVENWQVYYNLGNASYRLQRIGPAILNYERALKLNPDNEDIRYNLELANLSVVDRIPEPPQQAIVSWLDRQLKRPSFNALVYSVLLFYALYLLLLALPFYWPRAQGKRGYRLARGLSLSVGVVLVAVTLFRWYSSETRQYGVILASQVKVTSSPAVDATEVFELHEGVRLQIEEQSGEWLRIRLRDGKIGWVPQQAVGKI